MTKPIYTINVSFDEDKQEYSAYSPSFDDFKPTAKTLFDLESSLKRHVPFIIRDQNLPRPETNRGAFDVTLKFEDTEKMLTLNLNEPAPYTTSTGRPTRRPQFPRRTL